jgi:hypothetical protein
MYEKGAGQVYNTNAATGRRSFDGEERGPTQRTPGLGFVVSCLQRMTTITIWDTRGILVEYTLVLCAHNVGDCCNHLFTVNRVCAVTFSLISL